MAAPTVVAPNTLVDPGYLFAAPVGSAVPTHAVTGSKFTDTWSAPWVWLGATTDGSELQNSITVEYIRAAELFDPVGSSVTERNGQISFSLMDITLARLKVVQNGGTVAIVSGTTATQLNKYTPPLPSAIARTMIGWESTDGTMRVILYQSLNSGDVTMPFRKAPDTAVLPVTFTMEIPAGSSVPYEVWTAGVARA
jgi:hypothetical protein